MSEQVCLVVALPCDSEVAAPYFANIQPGSFAEEWRSSNPKISSNVELTRHYMSHIPGVLSEIQPALDIAGVHVFKNATTNDLRQALNEFDVIALLAHHIQTRPDCLGQLEMLDRPMCPSGLRAITADRPGTIVHLGVCHAADFIPYFKAKCSAVQVIASEMRVEPEFFLRLFWTIVSLQMSANIGYQSAHTSLRLAMIDTV